MTEHPTILTFDLTKVLNCDGTKIKYVYQKKILEIDIGKLPFPFPFPTVPKVIRCPICRVIGKFGHAQGHILKYKLEINEHSGAMFWNPMMVCGHCSYWGKYSEINTTDFMVYLRDVHRTNDGCNVCRQSYECPEFMLIRKALTNLYENYPDISEQSPAKFSEDKIPINVDANDG